MKRKRAILLVVAALIVWSIGYSAQALAATVYVSPPAFTFETEPELVVIPGSYVYRVPDIEMDIFFYQGFWFRPFEGRWYRSRHYNGPWGYVGPKRVPGIFLRLPDGYRSWHYGPDFRVHYRDLHRNWRNWERRKHWDRHDGWRDHRDRWGRRDRDHGRGGRDRDHGRGGRDRNPDRDHGPGGHGPGGRR